MARLVVAVVVLLALGGLYLLGTLLAQRADDEGPAPRRDFRVAPTVKPPAVAVVPRNGAVGARVLRRTLLRASPGGRTVRALGTRTGYGSRRVLAVVGQRGDWLGVLSDHMPNSRPGWIPRENAELLAQPYTLHVDLSKRRILVRRAGRVLRRITVAVGRAGHLTPTGRYAVTDSLHIEERDGGPYGCCALALTGRQPNVPQGWTGGDRIAIHGTTNEATLGAAVTAGCMRAREADMRWLLKRIPVGARVRIRA
jgi:hypothetical protein